MCNSWVRWYRWPEDLVQYVGPCAIGVISSYSTLIMHNKRGQYYQHKCQRIKGLQCTVWLCSVRKKKKKHIPSPINLSLTVLVHTPHPPNDPIQRYHSFPPTKHEIEWSYVPPIPDPANMSSISPQFQFSVKINRLYITRLRPFITSQ